MLPDSIAMDDGVERVAPFSRVALLQKARGFTLPHESLAISKLRFMIIPFPQS